MKRYDCHVGEYFERPTGEFVLYENHTAELAARDQTIKDLGFQLGMAEEGLANYAHDNQRMRDALLAIHGSTGPDGLWENKALHGVSAEGLQEPQTAEQTTKEV